MKNFLEKKNLLMGGVRITRIQKGANTVYQNIFRVGDQK